MPESDSLLLPDAAMMPDEQYSEYDNTPGGTPLADEEGMLPRDRQEKTAYYDYAAEKQLSHTDSKLFYQRSQLEAQKTGGSFGNSQGSADVSPAIVPRNVSYVSEAATGGRRRTDSFQSLKGAYGSGSG